MSKSEMNTLDGRITDIRIKVQQKVGVEVIDKMLYDLQIDVFKMESK